MILALLALASIQQVQLDQSLDLTLQPGDSSISAGNGNRGSAACDDFNRANGPMSGNWTIMSGSQSIVSGTGLGSGTLAYMNSTTANCAASASKVSIVFLPSSGTLKYAAAMTGVPGSSNGYFSKIQDQTGGMYANIGFYSGNNSSGGSTWGGFWGITPVAWGRMDVSYDAGSDSMRMDIDEFNDGSVNYTYYSNSGASGVGGLAGTGHGIGTYNDQGYDDWEINGGCGGGSTVVLTKTGSCPGTVTLSIAGATPGGNVFMVYGPAGSYTRTSNPCMGLTIPISPPTLAGVLGANGSGNAAITFGAPPGLCGRTVVAVDISSCQASNAIIL